MNRNSCSTFDCARNPPGKTKVSSCRVHWTSPENDERRSGQTQTPGNRPDLWKFACCTDLSNHPSRLGMPGQFVSNCLGIRHVARVVFYRDQSSKDKPRQKKRAPPQLRALPPMSVLACGLWRER